MPIEISRFIYFSLVHGCQYSVTVINKKPVRSPLAQGGLEIQSKVVASWDNEEGLELLKQSITEKYDFENRLIDSSKEILASLFADLQIKQSIKESDDELVLDLETACRRLSDGGRG